MEIIIGQIFGLLTAIAIQHQSGRNFILCKCKCGKEVLRREDMLIKGLKNKLPQSCGCIFKLTGTKHFLYGGIQELSGTYLARLRCSAKNRGLNFDVTKEYLYQLFLKQNKKCILTGLDIILCCDKDMCNGYQTASLDRIDNNKGYIEDNVQWIHKSLQPMKSNLTQEKFFQWCKLVVTHNRL